MSVKEDTLRELGLAFYGKITASLSHELNNSFAIIHEHNGLLDDMLVGANQGLSIDQAKLQRISKKVSTQLERGKELIKRLNKFAHRTDKPVAEIDVNEVLNEIILLSQRLAGMKGLSLEFKEESSSPRIVSNPFNIQHAIFTCFEIYMANAEANRLIEGSVTKSEQSVTVRIAGTAVRDDDVNKAKTDVLDLLLEQLNADWEVTTLENGEHAIELTLRNIG